MISGYRGAAVPSYSILAEGQIREIHLAVLRVLEHTGVRVYHHEALALLREAGCAISDDTLARIPAPLVEKCMRRVPSRVEIYDRLGRPAMRLEGRRVYFGPGTDLIHTYDLDSGELRATRYEDVARNTRICDALENYDYAASMGLATDRPRERCYAYNFRAMVENTVKPIMFTSAGLEDTRDIAAMAEAVAGGAEALRRRPFIIQYSEPISPLSHGEEALGKLLFCAERGIPIIYTPGLASCATAPATNAGILVTATAECLSGAVIQQLHRPGAPLISGAVATIMDVRTSIFSYGAPELRLNHSAYADLFHHYRIPTWGTAGCTDAHALDEQAGFEMAAGLLMAALDGTNLVHDVGYLGQGLIGHGGALVMCDEMIAWVKRITRGFEVSDDALATDTIEEVGPGGHFLTADHTLRHFRRTQWRPRLLNRDPLQAWRERGAPTYAEVCTERARDILNTHQPPTLDGEILKRLDELAEGGAPPR